MSNGIAQLEDGYTKIANELMEGFCFLTMSTNEAKVIFAILRKTYGYHKKRDRIALSQLALLTRLQKSHISRTIKGLITRRIVTVHGNEIGINKDITQWVNKLPHTVKLPSLVIGVTVTGNAELPSAALQKKLLQKKLLQKKIYSKENVQNLDYLSKAQYESLCNLCLELGLENGVAPKLYLETLEEYRSKFPAWPEVRECAYWCKEKGFRYFTVMRIRNWLKNKKSWDKEKLLKQQTEKQDSRGKDVYLKKNYVTPVDISLEESFNL